MKCSFKASLVAGAVAASLAAPAAFATNGYFKIGYGTLNRGMAGAGIAFGQDATAPATNPAVLSQVGNNLVGGVELFNPERDGRLDATGVDVANTPLPLTGAGASSDEKSAATVFAIPHLGASMNMGKMTVGLSIVANGGMNTRYNTNIYNTAFGPSIGFTSTTPIPGASQSGFAGLLEANGVPSATIDATLVNAQGTGLYQDSDAQAGATLGVNLAQAILSPTVSYQINDNHAVGGSLLLGYQQFRAYGLGLFKGLSSTPGSVTNQGNDHAFGAGVRLGWHGKLTNNFSVGVSASSKIYMEEFDDYSGLFAEQGDFDIPANYGIGLAYQPNDRTTFALDVQRILYGDVDAIANNGPTADEFFNALSSVLTQGAAGAISSPLGSDGGWGFGWDDITVVKLGINHKYNEKWTFRGGINYGENPIDNDQNLFNILAPGVVETHATVGFTYHPSRYQQISMAYMHAFEEEQTYTYQGTGTNAAFSFDTEIGMYQNALEVSYSMDF